MNNQDIPAYIDDTPSDTHLADLREAVKANRWRLMQDATMRMLDGSCLYDLAYRNRSYENYVFGNEWEYAEVSFKARGQTGVSRFKKRTVHYGVMRVELPRRLPNVVFDSLQHQQRQFRMVFESGQYIQLEGNFSKYFAAYFGAGYTIDDLSFITPEVMEAMLIAQNYDIEIVHNSLLLFGPVQSNPEAQLKEMSQYIKLIRQKLLHNILTYRDERLPYNQGRRIVARTGMFLTKRPAKLLLIVLILGAVFILPFALLILAAALAN